MNARDPNAKLDASCNVSKCGERATGTRAELVTAKWLPCPRKGGKLEWMCPAHNWALKPDYTGPMPSAWTTKKE